MFTKKPHVDTKKSIQKVIDTKKDSLSRLKHLRIILENLDVHEAKSFFEEYYSPIYYVFYDVFVSIECNFKQKGPKTHKEDFETIQYTLEKILTLLPELLKRRWQCHSIQRILKKFLHPGNSTKARREGIRLFIIWYQILGENAPADLDVLYCLLVPSVIPNLPKIYASQQGLNDSSSLDSSSESSTFYSHGPHVDVGPVWAGEISPIMPPFGGDTIPDNVTRLFMDSLLEFMVTQVHKIEWRDKSIGRQQRCFHFLFEKFKKFYLPHIFPHISFTTSLYKPCLELPTMRHDREPILERTEKGLVSRLDSLSQCQSTVIRWITNFSHHSVSKPEPIQALLPLSTSERVERSENDRHVTVLGPDGELTHMGSGMSAGVSEQELAAIRDQQLEQYIVTGTLYSCRENINLIHEIFRQAFLLSFTQSGAMRRVITVYKDWIYQSSPDKPIFLEEPMEGDRVSEGKDSLLTPEEHMERSTKPDVRAGLQNMLKVFVTNAANVFLLEISPEKLVLLEEQVEMCKRVLNMYRYVVMKVKMEQTTWEQLLMVLLQVTNLVLNEMPPIRKEETLGGRLAPALFQTLIVTWIKANLNVFINVELWNQFLKVLSSLTRWEELIKEWAKTMDTITRVLARQVYNLDLNDLPLNRPSEQKQKKRRGMTSIPSNASSRKVSPGHPTNQKTTIPSLIERASSVSDTENSKRTRYNSGDSSQRFLSTGRSSVHRSSSDSYLHIRKSIGDEHNEILASAEFYIQELQRNKSSLRNRSKSADFIHRAESPSLSESFEYRSRSPSPSPSSGIESIKDSPMQIDVMVSSVDNFSNHSEANNTSGVEQTSVMSGGTLKDWQPDVAVVLWKRMLGALGDVNCIQDPAIHSQVMDFLVELADKLTMIRCNMGITVDNQNTPPPPELVPPLHIFTSWLFQAVELPKPYERGKLLAYRLLCSLTIRRHDIPLEPEYLTQFYLLLHEALSGSDQAVINTVVKFSGPQLFSMGLPSCTLLMMDFISAANSIVGSTDIKGMPRTEAISTLGALLCLQRIYSDVSVLQPNVNEQTAISSKDAKDHTVNILIKAGKREPAGLARCIAISSLGIYVYGELVHESKHPRVIDAVHVLLAALRFNSRSVSQVASDMLLLLCDHSKYLLKHYPEIPNKIVEVIAGTLTTLLPGPDAPLTDEEKRLLLSLIFCLGEWCISIQSSLLSNNSTERELLALVFSVLNSIISGGNDEIHRDLGKHIPSVVDLAGPDVDPNILVENLQDGVTLRVPNSPRHMFEAPRPLSASSSPKERSPISSFLSLENSFLRASSLNLDPKSGFNVIKLAAKAVFGHLINYLGHFPMGVGAAHLTSLVAEQDDLPSVNGDDLCSQSLNAPNVQLFVLNNSSVFSVVQIPTLELPGGGATAGLTTAASQVRVIVRDQSGKFSWDCSILYGPPGCSKGSATSSVMRKPLSYSPHFPRTTNMNNLNNNVNLNSNTGVSLIADKTKKITNRSPDELPTLENSSPDLDNLDDLLQHIGHVSPECIARGSNPLNMAPSAAADSIELETATVHTILNQRNNEMSYVAKHAKSSSFVAKPIQPPSVKIPDSEFQYCRILLNQLCFLSWEKRPEIDLLLKNEKLIRELRNLDNQKCRETHKIAVIYVARGQEDKNSLLLNTGGSLAFEQFVSGLGWEVDLETHVGFMGGLQRNGSTGVSAPYYATSFLEVIFHVSTRMTTTDEDDSLIKKLRHLGNDEVHIVWSEHTRDYRRGIIATEFCDVLIVIYPINPHLFRIQISRKPEIPFFGPLFNGAIVDRKLLPGLVRATAINASRAKRSIISLSQRFFEERAKSLETIVKNQKEPTTFEQFAASVYAPLAPKPLNQGTVMLYEERRSHHSRPSSSSNLAAALLDSHHLSPSPNLRIATPTNESSSNKSSPQPPARAHRERPLSASQSHSSSPLSQH